VIRRGASNGERHACVALFLTLVVATASAQSPRAGIDVKICLEQARAAIDRLTPAAETVLGKPIDIRPPTTVDIFSSVRTHGKIDAFSITYAARVEGKEIRIAMDFCNKSEAYKLAIIAHELGHVVDNEAGTAPDKGQPNWITDPRELAATRRGGDILRVAGIGTLDMVTNLPPEHLVAAGVLRSVAVPEVAQKLLGSRKIALLQFDGKPGQWLVGRKDPLNVIYSPTDAVVDEFMLVFFAMQRANEAPGRVLPRLSIEKIARDYRDAGGDLAAVAKAMEKSYRSYRMPRSTDFIRAIRRVLLLPAAHLPEGATN